MTIESLETKLRLFTYHGIGIKQLGVLIRFYKRDDWAQLHQIRAGQQEHNMVNSAIHQLTDKQFLDWRRSSHHEMIYEYRISIHGKLLVESFLQ